MVKEVKGALFKKFLELMAPKIDEMKEEALKIGYEIGKESIGFFHPVRSCRNFRSLIRFIEGSRDVGEIVSFRLLIDNKPDDFAIGAVIENGREFFVNAFEAEKPIIEALIEAKVEASPRDFAFREGKDSFLIKHQKAKDLVGLKIEENNPYSHDYKFGLRIDGSNASSEEEVSVENLASCISFKFLENLNVLEHNDLMVAPSQCPYWLTREKIREIMIFLGFREALSNPLVKNSEKGILLKHEVKGNLRFLRGEINIMNNERLFEIGEAFGDDQEGSFLAFSSYSKKEALIFLEELLIMLGIDDFSVKDGKIIIEGEEMGEIKLLSEEMKLFFNVILRINDGLVKNNFSLDLSSYIDKTIESKNRILARSKLLENKNKNQFLVFLDKYKNNYTFRFYDKKNF